MKKQLMTLVLALTTALSLSAKCDWSKVSLGKSNKCNVYTFEVTGTADTCYKHELLIIKKGATTPLYKGTQRVFSLTFNDTGYYYVKTIVKNACCGGDTLFYDMFYVSCKPTTKPKCDWSKLGFGYGNSCNVYKFELGSIDTCISYTTYIYNYKLGKVTDTFRTRTFTKVFADTGKYKVYVLSKNKCGGCDTSFYRILSVTCNPTTLNTCNWSKIGLGCSNNCGVVTFELGSKDTCITGYSLWAYNQSTHKLDTLAHDRVFRRTLDTGWYTFKASFHNKCCNKDTFIYKEIHIGCDSNLMSLSVISRDNIRVFPIPADNKLDICLITSTKQPLVPYLIYDGNGRILYSGLISTYVQLNTTDWKDGVYTIKIGKLNQKIIINH